MNETRLFASLYCGVLACTFLLRHRDQLRFLRLMRAHTRPGRLLGLFPAPRCSDAAFTLVGAAFVLALAAAALGWKPRWALAGGCAAYFLYFGQILDLAYVVRKSNLVPQVLFVLALAPGTTLPMAAAAPRWPLLLAQAAVAQVYLSAGISKLRHSGFRWADGRQLQGVLLYHHLLYDLPRSFRLARNRGLCRALSVPVLIHQLTFGAAMLAPGAGLAYAGAALLFHLGALRFLRIDYLTYQGPAYLAFLAVPLAHGLR